MFHFYWCVQTNKKRVYQFGFERAVSTHLNTKVLETSGPRSEPWPCSVPWQILLKHRISANRACTTPHRTHRLSLLLQFPILLFPEQTISCVTPGYTFWMDYNSNTTLQPTYYGTCYGGFNVSLLFEKRTNTANLNHLNSNP